MIAILIGVPEPPLRGSTAGCGSGASVGAAAAGVLVDWAGVLAALLLVLSSLLDPHPAMAKASTAMVTASQKAPRLVCRATGMDVSPPRNGYLVNRRVWARPTPFPG
jgi:hypothetical protein